MIVGIFETTHFEAAYRLIKLFDNGVNEITIFCYEESYRQLKYLLKDDLHKFKWIVRKQAETKYRFVYRIYTETRKRKLELLFLNTVTDNFILYAWLIRSLKEVRTIVTLHSINNFFD